MNKLLVGMTLTASLALSSINVQASEATTEAATTEEITIEVGAGLKPSNPLYFLDKGLEDLRIFLAGEDKEAELMLQFAEERLAELEDLDEEDVEKYADELYEAYGKNLEKVNEFVAEKVAEGKANKADKLKEKLVRVSNVDQAMDKLNNVSTEIKDRIKEVQTKAYAIAIATELEEAQVTALKEQGFGYGEIIKLTAFAELSGKTIEELTFLDIYTTDKDGNKEVDFGKLAIELGMVQLDENGEPILDDEGQMKPDLSAIKAQFKAYQEVVRETEKEFKEAAKGKAEEKLKEIEKLREEVKKGFKEKVTERLQERLAEFNTKIDEIYNRKLELINGLDETVISADRKAELIVELDLIKAELIEKVADKVMDGELEPGDLGKLNAEIHQSFNELVEEFDLSDEEREAIKETLNVSSEQVRPIVDQIIANLESNEEVVLTAEQKEQIWTKVEELMSEDFDTEDLEELDEEIEKIVEKLLENVKHESIDLGLLFDELLNSERTYAFSRLDAESIAAFKERLVSIKAELVAEVNAEENAYKVRLEMTEMIQDELEAFMEEHEVANPNAEELYNEVLNNPLFRLASQLKGEEFDAFKQFLMMNKVALLGEVDLYENDRAIKAELTLVFLDQLADFKDAQVIEDPNQEPAVDDEVKG